MTDTLATNTGAGHGPWAARAWRANELRHRRPMHLVLVEPHPAAAAQAVQHLAVNVVDAGSFSLWAAAMGPQAGVSTFSMRACSLTSGHARCVCVCVCVCLCVSVCVRVFTHVHASARPSLGSSSGSSTMQVEQGRQGAAREGHIHEHGNAEAGGGGEETAGAGVVEVDLVTLDEVVACLARCWLHADVWMRVYIHTMHACMHTHKHTGYTAPGSHVAGCVQMCGCVCSRVDACVR